jgi:hypothetical protein
MSELWSRILHEHSLEDAKRIEAIRAVWPELLQPLPLTENELFKANLRAARASLCLKCHTPVLSHGSCMIPGCFQHLTCPAPSSSLGER